MRQYRGLTKDGTWLYGWYAEVDGKHYIIPDDAFITHPREFLMGHIEVIPETVDQSTGLKDMDGKDLDWWENDLLQSLGIDKRVGQVKYDEKCAQWRLYIGGSSWCSLAAAFYDGWRKVGDIHTKPELLEKQ